MAECGGLDGFEEVCSSLPKISHEIEKVDFSK